MSEMNSKEFALEVAKLLVWPLLVVAGLIWLGPDLKEILRNRTWKIGTFEVGDRITGLNESVQNLLLVQKDFLSQIQVNADDRGKVLMLSEAAERVLTNAQKGLNRDYLNIKANIPQGYGASEMLQAQTTQTTSKSSPTTARGWESLGFSYILKRDAGSAIDAFTNAEKIWPEYHNVSEIRRALLQDYTKLVEKDSPEWKVFYRRLLTSYSWGMPADVRQHMLLYAGKS